MITAGVALVALVVVGYLAGWLGAGGGGGGGVDGIDPVPGERLRAEVVEVVDGDTINVAIDGQAEPVRYIGLDTPEAAPGGAGPGSPGDECFGPEATRYNAAMVAGSEVELQIGAEPRDHYGRLLAYVRLGNLSVNAELLRAGYATALTIPPNDRRSGEFERLEAAAQRAGIGLWAHCP
ncbi:MAG TPA: thermonuclease family protein [Solirubrobacterales bacterium]|nr:thermonuclease family protein [Solirubrobacterales bacterium]